jgi:hypothetical protein
MGANLYLDFCRANTMAEAYNECVEEANEMHGHKEGYSGHINMSSGFVDKTAHYETWCKNVPASKRTPDHFASEMDQQDKFYKNESAWGICLEKPVGNNNKIKSTVEHFVFKGTRKWELVYIPLTHSWVGKASLNKADAVKEARDYAEKHKCVVHVAIERRLSKDSGNPRVATIKYKSSTNEKPGRYFFCGLASD